MFRSNKPSPASIDPHGYQPLVVDEDCATMLDRQEFTYTPVKLPSNWKSCLTHSERKELARKLEDLKKQKPPNSGHANENPDYQRVLSKYKQLGGFRAYLQGKYNHGRRIWYGDSIPWPQSEDCLPPAIFSFMNPIRYD